MHLVAAQTASWNAAEQARHLAAHMLSLQCHFEMASWRWLPAADMLSWCCCAQMIADRYLAADTASWRSLTTGTSSWRYFGQTGSLAWSALAPQATAGRHLATGTSSWWNGR